MNTRGVGRQALLVRRSLAGAALVVVGAMTLAVAQTKPAQDAKPLPVRYPLSNQSVLSPDEINTIRQFELQDADTRVAISIPADTKKKYAETNNIPIAEFNRYTPLVQAIAILKKGTDDQKKTIKISTDPASIIEYKTVIQRQILNGCASSSCHGSTAGGKLVLHNPASNDGQTYANFLILQQFSKEMKGNDSVFTAAERKLIQRGTGTQSLLANYALSRDVAEFDHPEVPNSNFNGLFRSIDDPNYQRLINWMDRSLRRDEMNYGIKFTAKPASAPSTSSTTAPAEPAK